MIPLIALLSMLVGTSFCFTSPINGWPSDIQYPGVLYKRDDTAASDILQSISDLILQAESGIVANDLKGNASNIADAINQYIAANGGSDSVTEHSIQDILDEAAKSLDGSAALPSLIADQLTIETSKIDSGLTLLNNIVNKAKTLEGAELNSALSALELITRAISKAVDNSVSVVTYLAKQTDDDGTDGSRRAIKKKKTVYRRGWEAGINGGYNNMGGWNVGASLSYSWRR